MTAQPRTSGRRPDDAARRLAAGAPGSGTGDRRPAGRPSPAADGPAPGAPAPGALAPDPDDDVDPLLIGRRIRAARTARGLSLAELAAALDRAPSQLSVIENGKRELRLGELRRIARVLEVGVEDLLDPKPPSRRAALEIALEKAQAGALYQGLGLPDLPVRKSLSDAAIETILTLHEELRRLHEQRAATPEEARRVNGQLRQEQSEAGNYYPALEETARELLARIGHSGGPLSHRKVSLLAEELGFSLHSVPDLPHSARSITDASSMRIYLPLGRDAADPRTTVLQALAAHVLGMDEPADYGELLRQRVEVNYLAAAMLVPEAGARELLQRAKAQRELSVEDLRDEFAVTYELAAHRFTNLATHHLDIPVHFLKVHSSGAIVKAYQNDHVRFPTDALGAVEGQLVCRWWSARRVFRSEDRMRQYSQYTDKPGGTYWCTSRIESGSGGEFSISVGTDFAHTKWFRGRETSVRHSSSCPDPDCCRRPAPELVERWHGSVWPVARLHASLLAAMPTGTFTGVDRVAMLEFLERHAPAEPQGPVQPQASSADGS
ncbi:helix-turn-helix domain-containing protein [Brachybacterium paraconglomeratum]|uniref:helix-turn-helix domain-containing protein n=1 Tax=Brachybacterium paraconglomeratum TaxID=173362 RepID=UPI0022AEF876|nr:helix-turn-helix domain-containing protein [Brachybacterium paraconglomeratum]MCZ4326622.1 helix-turn-helix domain-containing protein [Brachybacterium paraconglomeratum]